MAWTLSSDSHVAEPPDLWTGALGSDLADVAPRVEPGDAADWWVIGGQRMFSFAVNTKAGLRFEGQERLVVDYRFADVRPGAYLPDAHLTDNEADGVWGSVLYPSVATMLWGLDDAPAVRRLARIYNDWLAEWCSHDPGRLKGVAILDVDEPAEAVAELARARGRGLAGALIPVSPLTERPYDDPVYEPLWAAAADLGRAAQPAHRHQPAARRVAHPVEPVGLPGRRPLRPRFLVPLGVRGRPRAPPGTAVRVGRARGVVGAPLPRPHRRDVHPAHAAGALAPLRRRRGPVGPRAPPGGRLLHRGPGGRPAPPRDRRRRPGVGVGLPPHRVDVPAVALDPRHRPRRRARATSAAG